MTVKTLPRDIARCSGVIRWGEASEDKPPEHEYCPQRDSCHRYQALRSLDRSAGIDSYQGIRVVMAVENCQHKIDM